MNVTPSVEEDQSALWNGTAGRAWVDGQETLDRMLLPLEKLLVEEVSKLPARAVLDVGCGTGSTTLAIARHLGAGGKATGIDLSEPMVALARERARAENSSANFIRADAQTHPFAPGAFDALVSRFGVMFFEDPVQAFANLRRAARPNAATRLIAWRSAAENPFMTAAERAAGPLLSNLPPRKPDGPGQFAFADAQRVQRILGDSGWTRIELRPIDVECELTERELMQYLTRMGPVGMALQQATEQTRAQVIEAVRAGFEPYVHGTQVRYTAACWMICARA